MSSAATRGRPRKDCPEGVDPFSDSLTALAAAHGCSTATVSRWRREAEQGPRPSGRPEKTAEAFGADLDARRPGALARCQGDESNAQIGADFDVSAESVRQWRAKLAR